MKAFTSIFSNEIRDAFGGIKRPLSFRPNLRTTAGLDWESDHLGSTLGRRGTATASGASSLTVSAGMGTTQFIGRMVVAQPASGGAVYGIITSHTDTVLTVDRWYNADDPGGTAGTTPSSTSQYAIIPGRAPGFYLALTETAITPAAGDTTLSGEITTGGLTRAFATYAHTGGNTFYTLSKTFTATATFTVRGEAVFAALTNGTMPFESVEPNPPTLVSGDTLAQTVTVNI
jgi:hypothetical protein